MNIEERLVHGYDKNRSMLSPLVDAWLHRIVDDARRRQCGAVRKHELKHGEYYYGESRVAKYARWNAERQCFVVSNPAVGQLHYEYIRHADDEVAEATNRLGFRPDSPIHDCLLGKFDYPLEIK